MKSEIEIKRRIAELRNYSNYRFHKMIITENTILSSNNERSAMDILGMIEMNESIEDLQMQVEALRYVYYRFSIENIIRKGV